MAEAWIPSMIAVGALGLVWWGIRSGQAELTKKVDDMEDEQDEFLTEDNHTLLCENATLKVEAHITKELVSLKDEIFGKLRDIETLVKNGPKKGPSWPVAE